MCLLADPGLQWPESVWHGGQLGGAVGEGQGDAGSGLPGCLAQLVSYQPRGLWAIT